MNIDFSRIHDIYGEEMLNLIEINADAVLKNIEYLITLGFNDYTDIFERYPIIFIEEHSSFKTKFDNLIIKIGNDFVNIIENDLSVLECLL